MRGSSSATRRGVNPRDTSPRMRPCIGGSMARNDIVRWALRARRGRVERHAVGRREARVVAEPLHHVGVAGQRPEARPRRCGTRAPRRAGAGRWGTGPRGSRTGTGCRRGRSPSSARPTEQQAGDLVHAVGEVGVAEVPHPRLQQRARPAPGSAPGARPGRRRRRAPWPGAALNAAPMRLRRRCTSGSGARIAVVDAAASSGSSAMSRASVAQGVGDPGAGVVAAVDRCRLARVCSRRQNTSATRWSFDAKYV